MRTWRVASSDVASGLGKWADGLSEAFVRLEPFATGSDGFFGQIRQVAARDLDVSLVTSHGHEVRRLPEHIRRRASDTCFVNLLATGRSYVTQRGRHEAAPMDISIVDTREPFSIRHEAQFELVSIALPSRWLPDGERGHFALSRTTAGRELSTAIWGLSRTLLMVPGGDDALNDALAFQLRHSLALLPHMVAGTPERSVRIDLLQSYVRRNAADPGLNAERIALHFRLSVRRVHQLFEPTGTTVSEYVNDVRLDRATTMLADPHHADRLVSDIAWAVGYSDVSYFNRRFRRRFGCSPGSYRRAIAQ